MFPLLDSLLCTSCAYDYIPVFLIAYLSGSIPYGLLIGKWAKIGDLRTMGSGNIGATNMLRIGGKKLAVITLLADILKGTIPVVICSFILPEYMAFAALFAVLGHVFPIWLGFKGGKGVATSLGVFVGLSCPAGLLAIITWLAAAYFTRISSLSALISIAAAPIYLYFFTGASFALMGLIITILVWVQHHSNIARLLKGIEPKIGSSSKPPEKEESPV